MPKATSSLNSYLFFYFKYYKILRKFGDFIDLDPDPDPDPDTINPDPHTDVNNAMGENRPQSLLQFCVQDSIPECIRPYCLKNDEDENLLQASRRKILVR